MLCAYVDWEAPLPYFRAWIMNFHRNYEVLTNSLGGPTPRLRVEARDSLEEVVEGAIDE